MIWRENLLLRVNLTFFYSALSDQISVTFTLRKNIFHKKLKIMTLLLLGLKQIGALTCKITLIIRGRESTCNCIAAPRRYRLIPCIIGLGANICWVHFSKIGCKIDVMPSLTSTCFEMSNTILLWFGSTLRKLKINMYLHCTELFCQEHNSYLDRNGHDFDL